MFLTRANLKNELTRASRCNNNEEKKKLVEDWRRKYSEVFFCELLRCARDKRVMYSIANWDLGQPPFTD